MKKKVEFDANVRCGAKPDHRPTRWIPVPDDLYEWIPMHVVDDQIESVERFHVTLSPVEDPELCRRVEDPESFVPQDKPDYKTMWKEAIDMLTYVYHTPTKKTDWTLVEKLFAKHTPQTGVKKEET